MPASSSSSSSAPASSSSSPKAAALLSHLEQTLHLAHQAFGPASPRGRIRLHTLFSTPRPCRDLYPYAHVFPHDHARTAAAHPIDAYVEHVFVTASWSDLADDSAVKTRSTAEIGPAKLMYALECFLYTLPSHHSAILYVSKIDSSGWAPDVPSSKLRPFLASDEKQQPAPFTAKGSFSATRILTRAFLAYFAGLDHWKSPGSVSVEHISIHILARAQHAYLFPSSPENPRKRILSDGGLIQWWRAVVSEALAEAKTARKGDGRDASLDTRPYYIIPGYSKLDSHIILPLPGTAGASGSEALTQAGWRYGHPYSQKGATIGSGEDLPPLPLFGPSFVTSPSAAAASHSGINYAASAAAQTLPDVSKETPSIAVLMPHFSDDPKSRFIDELARDAHEQVGPMRKVPSKASEEQQGGEASAKEAADSIDEAPEAKRQKRADGVEADASAPGASASKPKPAGVALAEASNVKTPPASPSKGGRRPPKFTAAHRAAVLERQALDATSADEFWERMGFRQECCSGNAVGVFVVLITEREALGRGSKEEQDVVPSRQKVGPPAAQRLALPHPTVQDLAFKNLMLDACEWNKEDEAVKLTAGWDEAIAKALRRKGGLGGGATNGDEVKPTLDELSKGIIWTDILLDKGASKGDVAKAQAKWEEAEKSGASAQKGGAPANGAAAVNTLSVKRKKPKA